MGRKYRKEGCERGQESLVNEEEVTIRNTFRHRSDFM